MPPGGHMSRDLVALRFSSRSLGPLRTGPAAIAIHTRRETRRITNPAELRSALAEAFAPPAHRAVLRRLVDELEASASRSADSAPTAEALAAMSALAGSEH